MFCRAFPGHSVWQVTRHKVQQICEKATILKTHFDRYVCTMEFLKDNYHREVVPKAGVTVSPGITWQCLETFLAVETGQGAITGSGWRPGMLLHVLDWTVSLLPNANSAKAENPGPDHWLWSQTGELQSWPCSSLAL